MPESQGLTVVVTRPVAQAENLCQTLQQQGKTVIRFPVLEILATDKPETLTATLGQLEKYDLAIFVSANAVEYGLQQLAAQSPGRQWPDALSIAAIGQATARAVSNHGLKLSLQAPRPYNSESLLALPALQKISGQRLLIIRGEGGREHLAETLRNRGATVEYAECYRRSIPASDVTPLLQAWKAKRRLMFVLTSNEGLQNLYHMLGEAERKKLLASSIVVVSERAIDKAKELGFEKEPLLASAASDEAIVEAVNAWSERELQL